MFFVNGGNRWRGGSLHQVPTAAYVLGAVHLFVDIHEQHSYTSLLGRNEPLYCRQYDSNCTCFFLRDMAP